MYSQLIFLLDKAKILKFSRENAGERYVKHKMNENGSIMIKKCVMMM